MLHRFSNYVLDTRRRGVGFAIPSKAQIRFFFRAKDLCTIIWDWR